MAAYFTDDANDDALAARIGTKIYACEGQPSSAADLPATAITAAHPVLVGDWAIAALAGGGRKATLPAQAGLQNTSGGSATIDHVAVVDASDVLRTVAVVNPAVPVVNNETFNLDTITIKCPDLSV